MTLRDAIRDATVSDGEGLEVPLVLREEVIVSSTREAEPVRAGSWFWRYLVSGTLMGGCSRGSGGVPRGEPDHSVFFWPRSLPHGVCWRG